MRLWGRGYRMDEMRAAVLRVQLRKLPAIHRRHAREASTASARRSSASRGVRLRRIVDPAGDTGCFLITTYATPPPRGG